MCSSMITTITITVFIYKKGPSSVTSNNISFLLGFKSNTASIVTRTGVIPTIHINDITSVVTMIATMTLATKTTITITVTVTTTA